MTRNRFFDVPSEPDGITGNFFKGLAHFEALVNKVVASRFRVLA